MQGSVRDIDDTWSMMRQYFVKAWFFPCITFYCFLKLRIGSLASSKADQCNLKKIQNCELLGLNILGAFRSFGVVILINAETVLSALPSPFDATVVLPDSFLIWQDILDIPCSFFVPVLKSTVSLKSLVSFSGKTIILGWSHSFSKQRFIKQYAKDCSATNKIQGPWPQSVKR